MLQYFTLNQWYGENENENPKTPPLEVTPLANHRPCLIPFEVRQNDGKFDYTPRLF